MGDKRKEKNEKRLKRKKDHPLQGDRKSVGRERVF